MESNIEALEDVWDYSYSRVPYYGTNTQLMNAMNAVIEGSLIAQVRDFAVLTAAIMIRRQCL